MSETAAFLLTVLFICGLSCLIGYTFLNAPFITLPLSFLIGFIGGPIVLKALLKASK